MNVEAALAYAERHELHALVVARGEDVTFERYGSGYGATRAHPLYSGTKSFWGIAAVAAEEDGLLFLDERVCDTITEWREDIRKRVVTLRQLLTLTSGIGFGGLGAAVPLYAAALEVQIRNEPGTTFTYGGIPLQVFGAVLARKLAARKQTPHEYLRKRILDPIGVQIEQWRALKDGTHPLPTGAFLTPHAWLAYGRYICRSRPVLAQCFNGTEVNPKYGLGWWLHPLAEPDIVYASGAAGQALYIIPSLDLVVVHFGKSNSWRHETFLNRLLEPHADRRS